MSFETALRARLKTGMPAGVFVEWGTRPPGRFPAVVLTIVTQPLERHMTGSNGWRRPRVQMDVLTLDNAQKIALRDAVVALVAGSTSKGGVTFGRAQQVRWQAMDDDEGETFVWRDMIEAVLPHQLEN